MGMRPYWRKNYSPEPWIWNEKLCDAMKKVCLLKVWKKNFSELVLYFVNQILSQQINYDYDEIMTNDSKLLEWLAVLQVFIVLQKAALADWKKLIKFG